MDFNWKQAIEHNKRDLAMIVVELWAMVNRWTAEGRKEVEEYRAAFRSGIGTGKLAPSPGPSGHPCPGSSHSSRPVLRTPRGERTALHHPRSKSSRSKKHEGGGSDGTDTRLRPTKEKCRATRGDEGVGSAAIRTRRHSGTKRSDGTRNPVLGDVNIDTKPDTATRRSGFRVPQGGPGMTEGGSAAGLSEPILLPPPVYRMARKILRPAEAALRRLIVVVAAVLQFKLEERRAKRDGRPLPDFSSFIKRDILPAFNLIDPRKSFGEEPPPVFNGPTPRIWALGINEPDYPNTRVEDIDAALIIRRIRVLEHALNTLPRQAKRLARLMVKRRNNQPGRGRVGPIRPGKPPGNRNRHIHAVDAILSECHWLAREVAAKPP